MTVSTVEYFPTGIFRDKNGPCEVKYVVSNLSVANNQVVVAAVSGKILMPISIVASSGAASGLVTLKDGNAGTAKFFTVAPPNTGAPMEHEFNPAGWMRTSTGVGIYADCATTASILSIAYIEYTP